MREYKFTALGQQVSLGQQLRDVRFKTNGKLTVLMAAF